MVIINGRPVRDPALLQAVLAAYRPLLPRDRFPLVVLAVALAPADVDANVHPTKAWVRFRQPRVVQEMLVSALHEALRKPTVVPTFGATAGALDAPGAGALAELGSAEQHALFQEPLATYVASRFGRVLGQVQDTFIVSPTEDEVFFLDQHVVHERVVFERCGRARGGTAALAVTALPRAARSRPRGPGPARALARARSSGWGSRFEGFGGDAVVLRAGPHAAQGRRAQAPDRGGGGGARRVRRWASPRSTGRWPSWRAGRR